jgi:DNA repair protein RecO (recombination protein O)
MIIRSDAVVLRSIPYGETSRIVSLFTRERGRLSVMAKGARVPGSRFGAALQPLSYCQSVFYHKPGRGIHTLSDASLIEPLHRVHRDMERLSTGLRMVELVSALTHEEEANPFLFNLAVQVLHYLDGEPPFPQNLLPYFQLRMARALGFGPRVERAGVEAVETHGGFVSLATGGIVPGGTEHARHASRAAIRSYAVFALADVENVVRMDVPHEVSREVERLVDDFMRFHSEDAYPDRSARIMSQVRDAGHSH